MDYFYSDQQMVDFIRGYLALFYTGVALFYTVRILLKQKQPAAVKVIFPGQRFASTWWNHMSFRLFRAAIWGVCVIRLLDNDFDAYLGTFYVLNTATMLSLGVILLTAGFIATVLIHFSLGKYWRTGIDPNGPAHLRTTGIYSYSRHPMFMSIMLSQLGFFFALPSLFSFICLGIGVLAIQRQSVAEEKHLLSIYPDQYSKYQQQVSKWL